VALASSADLRRMGDAAAAAVARTHDAAEASGRWIELLYSVAG
jgi:hypothetical protein